VIYPHFYLPIFLFNFVKVHSKNLYMNTTVSIAFYSYFFLLTEYFYFTFIALLLFFLDLLDIHFIKLFTLNLFLHYCILTFLNHEVLLELRLNLIIYKFELNCHN